MTPQDSAAEVEALVERAKKAALRIRPSLTVAATWTERAEAEAVISSLTQQLEKLREERKLLEEIASQFLLATDPLDIWLVIDGDYVRPATRQETEFCRALGGSDA